MDLDREMEEVASEEPRALTQEEQAAKVNELLGQFVERAVYHPESGLTFLDFSNGLKIAIGEMYWEIPDETPVKPN